MWAGLFFLFGGTLGANPERSLRRRWGSPPQVLSASRLRKATRTFVLHRSGGKARSHECRVSGIAAQKLN